MILDELQFFRLRKAQIIGLVQAMNCCVTKGKSICPSRPFKLFWALTCCSASLSLGPCKTVLTHSISCPVFRIPSSEETRIRNSTFLWSCTMINSVGRSRQQEYGPRDAQGVRFWAKATLDALSIVPGPLDPPKGPPWHWTAPLPLCENFIKSSIPT